MLAGCYLFLLIAPAQAGDEGKTVLPPNESTGSTVEERPGFRISAEYNVEETYIGEGAVSRGRDTLDDFNESNTLVSFVLTPRVSFGVLRLGVGYERFDFGFSPGSPLPNLLQSANLVVGLDTQFSDSILVRFEAQPGYYGAGTDDLDWRTANVPFVIGGTYIYSPSLQLVLGIGVDVNVKDADGLTALDYAMGRGYVPFLAMPEPPNKPLADLLRGKGANIELAKTPDWPPQGPPIATAVYDSFIWPVDPVGP
jgi:hypothetical protein